MAQVEEWLLPLDVEAVSPSAEGETPLVMLRFTQQHQEQSHWCWAAIAASLSVFFQGNMGTQCAVATRALNQPCCGQPAPCNVPGTLEGGMEAAEVLREATETRTPFQQLEVEIENGNPIGVGIGWVQRGGGHAVTLYGFMESPSRIYIADPWFGRSLMRYPDFPALYQGGGIWAETGYT